MGGSVLQLFAQRACAAGCRLPVELEREGAQTGELLIKRVAGVGALAAQLRHAEESFGELVDLRLAGEGPNLPRGGKVATLDEGPSRLLEPLHPPQAVLPPLPA